MRTSSFTSIIIAAFTSAVACAFLAGCGHSHEGEEAFDTLQDCYDEHISLGIRQAIISCCFEHPIDGEAPSCEATQAACVMHVDAELDGPAAADIEAACTEYIEQL